ncbi:MAG: hypothetical protein RBR78_01180 [Flavobacteriaceae bacterium]|jgi:hypothetical protein|nr:hypothetical protein [Flavobacteriaceae bacterium]HTO34787.1 hypothetical protein [Flavobacterium sp.]
MKKLFLFTVLLSFAFIANGCSDDDKSKKIDNSIVGTWKLIEEYGSSGGAGQWYPVENGYTYSFEENNILVSNRFSCNGTYNETTDSLTINFDCSDSQFYLTYDVSFENNYLVLTPNPLYCDEGCAEKYQRIN